MKNDSVAISLTTYKYYAAIAALILSFAGSLVNLGYSLRQIDQLESKVNGLEQSIVELQASGSVPARLTAKDVEWLGACIKDLNAQLDRIERKVDMHLSQSIRNR